MSDLLLAADQSIGHAAYALLRDGLVINGWSFVAPAAAKTTEQKSAYQQGRFLWLLRHIKSAYIAAGLTVALEGTFLHEYERAGDNGRKGKSAKAVTAKGDLDRLIGRLQAICDIEGVSYQIVEVTDMGNYLGLPFGRRELRKRRAIFLAQGLLEQAGALPEVAQAFDKVYQLLLDYNPNASGAATFETMLNRANKLMPEGFIVDLADAICIGDIAYRNLQQEAIERL